MFLKQKIRKAFKSVTPNLSDQMLQEHPQQDIPIQSTNCTPFKKSGIPPAPQWIAAVAAIALIIGLAGDGIGSFLGDNMSSGSYPTNPSADPTTTPTEAPWVALTKDERYDNLVVAAENCINPSDRKNVVPTGEYFSTTWQGAPAWVISATYKGYWYQLTITDEGLKKLEVILTDSIKDDIYITDTAATQIAYTQVDNSLGATNFAWFRCGLALDQDDSGTDCYYVTLERKDPAYNFSGLEYKTFRINAYTGIILGVEEFHTAEHGDWISDIKIQNQLWPLVLENPNDLPGYKCLELTSGNIRIHNGDLFYQTTITYDGHEYTFETDRAGKILSIDISSTDDCRPGDVIAKGVALEIVCLARGEAFADGQKVTTHLEDGCYHITICDGSNITYMVNASTGELVEYYTSQVETTPNE